MAGINAILFLLAVVGYRRAKSDYRVKLVSLHMIVYVTCVSVIAYCDMRCSLPVMPLIIMLAASQAANVLDGGSARGRIVIDIR